MSFPAFLVVTFSLQPAPLTHIDSLSEEMRAPARVTVMVDGTVLVTDPIMRHIARYGADGELLGTWSVAEAPIGVAAHADGRYFVSLRDTGQVAIYDAGFNRTGYLGQGNPLVDFVRPTDIEIATTTGNIYVADSGGDRVYGFAPSGALVLLLGSRGGGNGAFRYPSAVTFDEPRNRLIVADHDNFRVQVFTAGGLFQRRFGDRNKYPSGGVSEGWMPRTQGLAVNAAGQIYVADAMMSTVRAFDTQGVELAKLLVYGSNPGNLSTACDLAFNADGTRLYVVSTNAGSVEVYQVSPAPFTDPGDGPRFGGASESPIGGVGRDPSPESAPDGRLDWPWELPDGDSGFGDDGSNRPGPRSDHEGPHMIDAPIICGRCHGIRSQPGGHEGLVEGQTVLCASCHSAGGQAMKTPIHKVDTADPYGTNPSAADFRGISHAWAVAAVNPAADSVGPTAGGDMSRYVTSGQMKCATCHNAHTNDYGAPYLRVSNTRDAMCKECHAPRNEGPGNRGTHAVGFTYPAGQGEFPAAAEIAPLAIQDGRLECATCHGPHYMSSGGANGGDGDGNVLRTVNGESLCTTCHRGHIGHTPAGTWQPTCQDCHDPHDPASNNLSLVARTVRNQSLGLDKTVAFTARTGAGSFDDGDPALNDGICQVCHTATSYHRHDGAGQPHNDGTTCTDCHPHNAGFMPTGGSCVDCHGSAQDNGDGVPAGGRRAVVGEFPANDAHGHYGVELGSDACGVCHSQTTHMDGYVDLVDPDDANHIFRFVQPADITADPDLSDFCSRCHDADGASRLAAPLDPFGNGNLPPDVATRFMGSLQWSEWTGDVCVGEEGTLRAVNSHHDISSADQTLSGAKLECLSCHGAHNASAAQPLADPFAPTTAWTGTQNDFCIACHHGGAGPADPGFPPGVSGPSVPLRPMESCAYTGTPWWTQYTWTHSAHGLDSKRGWNAYSGGPAYELNCTDCHDPHGSYSLANPTGNPYMIRDFVDGTALVDDGYRYAYWTGPPWTTFGSAREVRVPVSGTTVGWGGDAGLCAACHPTWLATIGSDWWHDYCTNCQACHGHGQAWGEHDWEDDDDDTPCPPPAPSPFTTPPVHDLEFIRAHGGG